MRGRRSHPARWLGAALVLEAVASSSLHAQASCATAAASQGIITAVEVHRADVFDTTEANRWWQRLGNSLHAVTRPGVIHRELLLEPCAPYDSARAAETERNLRSLGIFRHVAVDTVHRDTGVVLQVVTHDGWSTRPELNFSSTGDQATFTIGLTEENFLGRATRFGLRYSSDPDRRTISARFTRRRAIGDFGIDFGGENRTDGWTGSAGVSRPFFSAESPVAGGVMITGFDGDVHRYRGGDREPAVILRRRLAIVRMEGARALAASPERYWRIGAGLQVVRDAYAPLGDIAPRRTTGTLSFWTELSRTRFAKVEQFRSLGRAEDVDLSPRLRAGMLLAPEVLGYERNGAGLELSAQAGLPVGRGFIVATAGANGLYSGAGLDSGRVAVNATMMVRPADYVTLLLHGRTGWQERPPPGEEYELGFGRGLRGHRIHAFTGDRVRLLVAEARWTPLRDLFGVLHVGVAAVGAHGGAWWAGDERRWGSELGGGLRIAPTRMADGDIGRIDLMWRFETDQDPGGWTLVFGEGLSF